MESALWLLEDAFAGELTVPVRVIPVALMVLVFLYILLRGGRGGPARTDHDV